jgi:hypothetical protein
MYTTCKLALPILRRVGGLSNEVLILYTEIERKMQKEGERHFVDKLIYAIIANNYDSDGLGSLHATAQSLCCYLKILKV